MLINPFAPFGIFGIEHWQKFIEMLTADSAEPVSFRVPHTLGFFVIQDKGVVICPPGWG